jgi:vacuolar protein sorting-associated protein VTA1
VQNSTTQCRTLHVSYQSITMSEEEHESVDNVPTEATKLIGPFIKRGKELLNVQPLVSYYCYLYAAQLILESQLHLTQSSVATYIEVLLNAIEEFRKDLETTNESKSASVTTEILTDKEKSFKLVLGFALSIFNNASKDIETHTASKRTVQSFMAFLDFIQVTQLWPEFYSGKQEQIHKQIKYAKFHSNRIMKAIKNGEDANDYITRTDEQELNTLLGEGEAEAEAEVNGNAEEEHDKPDDAEIDAEISEDRSSVDPVESDELSLPSAPSKIEGEMKMPSTPVLIKGRKNDLGLPTAPESSVSAAAAAPTPVPAPPKIPEKPKVLSKPIVAPKAPTTTTTLASPAEDGKVLSRADVEKIWTKEEVIANAQRKAKFAISALNYEDVETAIKELQEALRLLRGE